MKPSGTIINTYNIIILAAGGSSRLGEAKQLLEYDSVGLLQHAVNEAAATNAKAVVVVLGSQSENIAKQIKSKKLVIVQNPEWEEGLASSIRSGINALEADYSADGAILMVCDQPHVTTALLDKLLEEQLFSRKPIVASEYRNTVGTPALFHHSFYPALQNLQGDAGAKKILLQHASEVHRLSFPEGAIDIDTRIDYERLLNTNSAHDRR